MPQGEKTRGSCRAVPPPQPGQPKQIIRIAIADDHPIFRDCLRKLLALEEDLEVVAEARDGTEVLDILKKHEPDILLLDLKMPSLDGRGTLQRLQAEKIKTKVIVLTASDDESEYVEMMRFGTSGIVLKQAATDLLIKSIRKVHAGEIWLDSRTMAAVMKQYATPMLPPGGEKSILSRREQEIVELVAKGLSNKEVAGKLFISEQTVKNHLHNVFDKLGLSDRLQLALYTIRKSDSPQR